MKKFTALLTLILWSISMTASAGTDMAVLCVEQDGRAVIEYTLASIRARELRVLRMETCERDNFAGLSGGVERPL